MSYWSERQEDMYRTGEQTVNEYYAKLEKAFNQERRELQKTIEGFYFRYAEENGLTYAAAEKRLGAAELGELQDFIDLTMRNIGKYSQEVNNLSIKAQITRYQALEAQVDATLRRLYAIDYQAMAEKTMKDVYADSYYQTWYNIDQMHGVHSAFAQVAPGSVEKLLEYPFNGANFSSWLWKQKDHLQTQLMEALTAVMVQGKNPQTLAADFAKKMQVKKFDAYRLLHTESSFLMSEATHAAYKEDGVEKYQILATLDSKTCGVCGDLDNEVFDVDKAIVGVNMAPFHCFCRCTDTPYYDDMDISDMARVARDPETGKTYEVPADMTYPEWHAEYIKKNPEKALAEKKLHHKKADMEQYDKYGKLLGPEYIPEKFEDFQSMKYGPGDEYGVLKAQSKGMSYYNKALAEEPDITAHVKEIADQSAMDVSGIDHRIKSKDSYLEKIRRKYDQNGNEYEVKDILRYTYTSPPSELTEKTLKSIELHSNKGYNTIEIKNYWTDDMNPYNGINTTLRTPTGQAFELQYHTPESFELKNGKMHELYEKQRQIKDTSSKAYMDLDDQMFELSDSMVIPENVEGVKNRG